MANSLQAGVYRVDITPPLGISMCGYFARAGVSNRAERPLTATAVVLASGGAKVAILGCDLISILNPAVDEIRMAIASAIGTTVESILINCSHTHCGPNTWEFSWESDDQHQLQRSYLDNLNHLLTGCAVAADRQLRPARIGTGNGSSHIGINRRELDESGKIFLGENPEGPMDPTVGVIRIDEPSGRPMAVLFNYGCHTVTMGPKFLGLSPDFPGPARELIESATGALSIFLQGAGGDINPVTGIGPTEDDTENMTRLGQSLGAEVVRVLSEIRTSSVRGERIIFASLTKNSMYPYVPVSDSPIQISAAGEASQLPLLPLPSLEDARGIQSFCSERLEKAIQSGLPPHQLAFHYRFRDWSNCLLRAVESGKKQTSVSVNLQAIRLGDVAVASAAGETLSELGLRVKTASPFADTRFLGYSNGCVGYIPNAECYPAEGWSPWETYLVPDMLCQAYMLPMHFAPTAAQHLVDRSVSLLKDLA
jgi:neutral ceramidase